MAEVAPRRDPVPHALLEFLRLREAPFRRAREEGLALAAHLEDAGAAGEPAEG